MVVPEVTDDGDHLAGTGSETSEAVEDMLYSVGGSEPPENDTPDASAQASAALADMDQQTLVVLGLAVAALLYVGGVLQ